MADKTLKQARQYLQGRINALTGAPAYEYMPAITDESKLESFFGIPNVAGDTIVNGWAISREASESQPDTDDDRIDFTFVRTYSLAFHGYYGMASGVEETLFDDQIEALLDGLDSDSTLSGNCDEALPCEVRLRDYRFLGNVLCHHAEITMLLRMRRDRIA